MLYLMKKTGTPLSEMVSDIFLYPQILENVKVKKKDVIKNTGVLKKIKEAEKILDGKGRVLVRPSGTEQKIRVMVEGSDRETIQTVAAGIVKTIVSASSRD